VVCKFQNAHQARTGCNMVKSSSPNVRSTFTHLPLPPYPHFLAELASILLLAFSLFALVAALWQCLCSESPYLSIKLYCIYVCYMNITLYIVFDIIRGRSWNVLPMDTGALLYIYKASVCVKIQIFWNMTLCWLMNGYQCCGGGCCIHH
jgi:hypothetical protein